MSKARDLANAGTALTTVSATELGYLDGVTSAVQTQIDSKEPTLPSQTGNTGKYLTTDGTDKSWGTVSQYALPTQTGNSGKYLTTNGTAESWGTVSAGWSLIATATLSGSTGISFTSIPTTYTALRIITTDLYASVADSTNWMYMRFNNDSTANNYINAGYVFSGGSLSRSMQAQTALGNAQETAPIQAPTSSLTIGNEPFRAFVVMDVINPSDTTRAKVTKWSSSGDGGYGAIAMICRYKGTSAISQIDFIRNGTATYTGNVYLYGM
jgi:hypothetical protein